MAASASAGSVPPKVWNPDKAPPYEADNSRLREGVVSIMEILHKVHYSRVSTTPPLPSPPLRPHASHVGMVLCVCVCTGGAWDSVGSLGQGQSHNTDGQDKPRLGDSRVASSS